MITLDWWVLLIIVLGAFVAGEVIGIGALLTVAVKFDKARKGKLGNRYPEGSK